ncbi:MAG: microcystin-dependent protein [Yoonia sp.]|jgi:microcystin-dependent protein
MTYLKKATLTAACALTLSMGLTIAPDKAQAGVDPFLGDIMIVGFSFCPRGWAAADGQLLAINSNQSLFALLGSTYGGDGRTTFALPDLRGRAAIGQGSGPGLSPRRSGQNGGSELKTMTVTTMASHSHAVNANNLDGNKGGPGGKLLAAAPTGGSGNETIYSDTAPTRTMAESMIGATGGSAPISTQDPFLSVYHCIATEGSFPPRS